MSAQRGVHRRPRSRVNRAFSVVGVLAALAMIIGGLTLTAGSASATGDGGSPAQVCSGSEAQASQDCQTPDPCKDKKATRSGSDCKPQCPDPSTMSTSRSSDQTDCPAPDPCKDKKHTKKAGKSGSDCTPECPDPTSKKAAKSSSDCTPVCPDPTTKKAAKSSSDCTPVCPEGQVMQGDTCVTPPADCPQGQVKQGDTCVTPPTDNPSTPSTPGTPDSAGTSTITAAAAAVVDSTATVAQEPPAQVTVPQAATVTSGKPAAKKPAKAVRVPTAAVLPTAVNAGGGSTWPKDPRLAWLLLVLGVVGLLGSGARLAWDRRG